MKVIVSPGTVKGSIQAPPSKSYGQRALAAALLTPGQTRIENLGDSEDEQAAISAVKSLRAEVVHSGSMTEVLSPGIQPGPVSVCCNESGLSARLFLPIAALTGGPSVVTGSGTLLQRPMKDILALLPELGVRVLAERGRLPVTLTGTLQPQNISIDGSLSSQFLSGLLFAFAAAATEKVTIEAQNLASYGYAKLSVEVLQAFGYDVSDDGRGRFTIHPAEVSKSHYYKVPGDFSSAAPIMLAAALTGSIIIENLGMPSLQPDAVFADMLQQAGVPISVQGDNISIGKASSLRPFDFDATHAPDLFPVLAILATQCTGISRIKGLHRLVHKESNRAESISAMLRSFGGNCEIKEDCLLIEGPCTLTATTIHSFNDHRIVMAAAIGALVADGPVEILGPDAVHKSYPAFFEDLKKLGRVIEVKS